MARICVVTVVTVAIGHEGRRRYLTIVKKNERKCLQEGRGWEGRV
jgi:hypothetical protein